MHVGQSPGVLDEGRVHARVGLEVDVHQEELRRCSRDVSEM